MAMGLLNFLQDFLEKKRNRTHSAVSNSWDMASFSSNKPLETISPALDDGNVIMEDPLEQVGGKLERAQHRLGLIDHKSPNHLPTSLSTKSSSQLRVIPNPLP